MEGKRKWREKQNKKRKREMNPVCKGGEREGGRGEERKPRPCLYRERERKRERKNAINT
jgi:hypothetical protein